MTAATSDRDDILAAFAAEPDAGRAILERYLQLYPDHAEALIDLSRLMAREPEENDASLSAEDTARIAAAWTRHVAAQPKAAGLDRLSVPDQRRLAQTLALPRQVITGFRERRVMPASVPRPFLQRMAEAMESTAERLLADLAGPPAREAARAFKADVKPAPHEQVTFERLLIDAAVEPARRAELLEGGD